MQERVRGLKKQFPGDAELHAAAKRAYKRWLAAASKGTVAPTLVGGSKKHGGADLGPTRAKRAWADLGVDAMGVADAIGEVRDPVRDFLGERGPKLTVEQAKLIQGFPPDWRFSGRKTAAYRQAGNAFPPPVAKAVGLSIIEALHAMDAAAASGQSTPAPPLPRRRSAPRQLLLTP
jgi:DNA (cytosine-5)-methyltransferase 1